MRQEPKRKDKSQKWFFPSIVLQLGQSKTIILGQSWFEWDLCNDINQDAERLLLCQSMLSICVSNQNLYTSWHNTTQTTGSSVCVCVMGFYPTPPIRTHRQQTQTLIFLNKISNKLFPNHSKQLNVIKLTGSITSITRPQLPGKQELQDESLESNKETQAERQNLMYSNCCWSVGIFYYNRYQSQYIEGQ